MSSGDAELVFRPTDRLPYPRVRQRLTIMLGAWTAMALIRLTGPAPFELWVFVVVLPGALFIRAVYFARATIRVTATEVEARGYFGFTRCPRRSIALVVVVNGYAGVFSYSGIRLHFLDAAGRTLLSPSVRFYRPDELRRFREDLGGPWAWGKDALQEARSNAPRIKPEIPPGARHDLQPFPPPPPASPDGH